MSGEQLSIATVDSVQSDGTVNITSGVDSDGDPGFIPGVPCSFSHDLREGDTVGVTDYNGSLAVTALLGRVVPAAPSAPQPPVASVFRSNNAPGSEWTQASVYTRDAGGGRLDLWFQNNVDPPPPPVSTTGTVTGQSQAAAAYRPAYGWDGDHHPRQGDYSGRGPFTGCWFFGSGAWNGLAGKTVTATRVTLTRLNHGGVYAGRPVHLWGHPNGTRQSSPGRDPSSSWTPGNLATGVSKTFRMGASLGQYLQNHPDGGICCYDGGSFTNYMILSVAAHIEVDWKD